MTARHFSFCFRWVGVHALRGVEASSMFRSSVEYIEVFCFPKWEPRTAFSFGHGLIEILSSSFSFCASTLFWKSTKYSDCALTSPQDTFWIMLTHVCNWSHIQELLSFILLCFVRFDSWSLRMMRNVWMAKLRLPTFQHKHGSVGMHHSGRIWRSLDVRLFHADKDDKNRFMPWQWLPNQKINKCRVLPLQFEHIWQAYACPILIVNLYQQTLNTIKSNKDSKFSNEHLQK